MFNSCYMRKIQFLTIVFLFLQIAFCKAQDTTTTIIPKDTMRNISLGIFFSRDYCVQKFNPIGDNPTTINYYKPQSDSLNKVVSPGLGFTVGLDALFPIKEGSFAIKTGLYYAIQRIRYNGFVYDNAISPDYEIYRFGSYRTENMSVFEVPVALDYSILSVKKERRFHLSCFAGVISSINNAKYIIQIKRFWFDYNAPQSESSYGTTVVKSYSTLGVGAIGGIRTEFMLNKRSALSLSPMVKYYPLKYYRKNTSVPLRVGIRTINILTGCAIGFVYHFD